MLNDHCIKGLAVGISSEELDLGWGPFTIHYC
jgi:hypothetical protein